MAAMFVVMPSSAFIRAKSGATQVVSQAEVGIESVSASGETVAIKICEYNAVTQTTSDLQTINCVLGQVINLSDAPTKEKYTFNGLWTEKPANTTPTGTRGEQYVGSDGSGIKTLSAGLTTLYVHWRGAEYQILFYARDIINNGSNLNKVAEITGYYGSTFNDCEDWPTSIETSEQYLGDQAFLGWTYHGTSTYLNKNDVITKKTKLAISLGDAASVVGYTVTLSAPDADTNASAWGSLTAAWICDGKTCYQEYRSVDGTSTCTLGTLPTPTRTGYKFLGWGDGITYATTVTADVTYAARWEAETYSITLVDGAGVSKTIEIEYGEESPESILTTEAMQKPHYDFKGYYDSNDVQCFDSAGNRTDGCTISSGTTLYAKYEPTNYPITYNLNGGTLSTSNPTTYNIETATFTLNNPTKASYTFVGWQTPDSATPQPVVTITRGSYEAMSYTAVFAANVAGETSNITFVFNCANYANQPLFIYIIDQDEQSVCEFPFTQSTLMVELTLDASAYDIKFKLVYPNCVVITSCADFQIDNNVLVISSPQSKTYQINFTLTDIKIISAVVV